MSIKLKENQLLAAKLLSFGLSSKYVANKTSIREETLSRWRKNQWFIKEVTYQQDRYLHSLEEGHFQMIKQSILAIQEALNSDEIPLKAKASLGIQYLRYATKHLIKEFNENKVSDASNLNFKNNFLNY